MAINIKTRSKQRFDTLVNWITVKDSLRPLAGEVVVIEVTKQDTSDNLTAMGLNISTIQFTTSGKAYFVKVGNGADTLAALPYINNAKVTVSASATDDDVVNLEPTSGYNSVTYTASHAKKGPNTSASTTKGPTANVTVDLDNPEKSIKIPKVVVDAYGHTTGLTEQTLTIKLPVLTKNSDTTSSTKLTPAHGGEFTIVTGTSVSNHGITDNKQVVKLPSETDVTVNSSTATAVTPAHGGTVNVVTGVAKNNASHKLDVTTTPIKLPAETTLDYVNDTTIADATGNKAAVLVNLSTSGHTITAEKAYVPTQAYVDALIEANNAMVFKGTIATTAQATSILGAKGKAGDTYIVSADGVVIKSITCNSGDMLICSIDQTTASDSDWHIIEHNLSIASSSTPGIIKTAGTNSSNWRAVKMGGDTGVSGADSQSAYVDVSTDGTTIKYLNNKLALNTVNQGELSTTTAAGNQNWTTFGTLSVPVMKVDAYGRVFELGEAVYDLSAVMNNYRPEFWKRTVGTNQIPIYFDSTGEAKQIDKVFTTVTNGYVTKSVGGISKGEKITQDNIDAILTKLLGIQMGVAPTAGTFSFTLSPSTITPALGVTTQTGITASWKIEDKETTHTGNFTPTIGSKAGTATALSKGTASGSISGLSITFDDSATSKSISGTAAYGADPNGAYTSGSLSSSKSITIQRTCYYGAGTASSTTNRTTKSNWVISVILDNNKAVFQYPKVWDTVTKIVDANGYDVTSTFVRSEVTKNGGTYYQYISESANTGSFKYTLS